MKSPNPNCKGATIAHNRKPKIATVPLFYSPQSLYHDQRVVEWMDRTGLSFCSTGANKCPSFLIPKKKQIMSRLKHDLKPDRCNSESKGFIPSYVPPECSRQNTRPMQGRHSGSKQTRPPSFLIDIPDRCRVDICSRTKQTRPPSFLVETRPMQGRHSGSVLYHFSSNPDRCRLDMAVASSIISHQIPTDAGSTWR